MIVIEQIYIMRKFKELSNPIFSDRYGVHQKIGLDNMSKSFSWHIEKALKRFNGIVSRKGGKPLIGLLLK